MSSNSNFVKKMQNTMRTDAGISGDAQRIEQIVWMLFLKVYDAKEENTWEILESDYKSIIPEQYRWRNWAKSDMTGDNLIDFVNNKLFPTLKNLEIKEEDAIKKRIVVDVFADANNYMKDGVALRRAIDIIDELELDTKNDRHTFGDIYESILKDIQGAGNAGEFYTPRALTDFIVEVIDPKLNEKIADFACGTGGFLTSSIKYLDKKVSKASDREYLKNFYGVEKKPFPHLLAITNLLLHDVDTPNIIHGNSLERNVREYTSDEKFDVILMNPPYGGSERKEIQINFPSEIRGSETADLFIGLIMHRLKKNGRAAVILPDGFLFGADNAKTNLKKKLLSEFNLHTIIRLPGSVFAPYTSIATNILFFDNTPSKGEVWFYRMDMPKGYKHFSKTKPIELRHFKEVHEWLQSKHNILDDDGNYKAKKFSTKELKELDYNLDQCGVPHIEEEILLPNELINQYLNQRNEINEEINQVLNEISNILEIDLEVK
ncbi:HsdM family class I SAM-dependent methyltransferase [Mycoplasmopsis verecunda]|uniref:site-specific DNA-methyltransferase (adenine-specific) n=1 Tax=Mycoplasmopsis verecunda TaxID=171291 RepID=A0A1T4LRP6_9BACT|nr:class I SAM-dependent DNA methyltransferase [Mycoplasmopsis verecunda]WPB54589.1 class I SAM-dependent DNA methyltransferase [Mycoplasmopsis verecunda]SJZ57355.1 type I restriction enzyme M protein [Mycoplasmopsis verecunda]